MRRFARYVLPVLAYAGLIFFLSSQPTLPAPGVHGFDKVAHFVVYAGLALLAARGGAGYGMSAGQAALFGAGLAGIYGGTDELHQSFVPGRSSEVLDLVADVLGGITGGLTWFGWARRRREAAR